MTNDEEKVREKFQRKRESGLVGPLCSRNPHDETVVVRRAQWWTNSGHPPGEGIRELGGSIRVVVGRAHSRINQPPHELTQYLAKSSLSPILIRYLQEYRRAPK